MFKTIIWFIKNTREESSKWCQHNCISQEEALKKLNHNIDICHYDSDKGYTGRKWSSPILWSSLKNGGLFVSDDINDNLAFKHFCQSVSRKPIIIEHQGKYVGIIQK
tara:strand:- start:2541 stop:2861 length:321 start_codon:yes stop_codon:yes gene_type:complete